MWAATLGDALRLLLAAEAGGTTGPVPTPHARARRPTPGPGATPGPTPGATPGTALPADVAGLIDYANAHFELAQTALRDGDFARYGTEIELVQAALQRLQVLAPGSVAPNRPGASTSPAP